MSSIFLPGIIIELLKLLSPKRSRLAVGLLPAPALALVQRQILDAVVCGAGKIVVGQLLERHAGARCGQDCGEDR